jgi:2-methylcitrate dehydratase PrpD
MTLSASESLAAWALSLRLDAVPGPVVAAAKRHLLDGLGTALAARRLNETPHVLRVVEALGGAPEASVIGGSRVAAPLAALANGTLIHALDFDDTHADALVHCTAVTLPAALAEAESRGAGGGDLLAACIAGYEVVARLGAEVQHGFHARGFHATSVCGTMSAALVAAKLRGLGTRDATAALGIAGSFASGTLAFLSDGSTTKQLHPGWASHAGMMAARLAEAGASGPATILEGPNGLFRSFTGTSIDPGDLVEGLGTRWETLRITLKPYPACQLSHASIDAALGLHRHLPGGVSIDSVTVQVPSAIVDIVCEPAATKARPRTTYEAKFSLPFVVAASLIDGHLDVDSFTPRSLQRQDVLDLAGRVEYEVRDGHQAAASAPGRVCARLSNGTTLTEEVPESGGAPTHPLTDEQMLSKLRLNLDNRALSEELVECFATLEELDDVRTITDAVRAR